MAVDTSRLCLDHAPMLDRRPYNAEQKLVTTADINDKESLKSDAGSSITAWLAAIFAVLSITWTVNALHTSSVSARMAVTQTAIANQINFVKLCLHQAQLETEEWTPSELQLLVRQTPCVAFLRTLDFDAMLQALTDPAMVPELKPLRKVDEMQDSGRFDDKDSSLVALVMNGFIETFSFIDWFSLDQWKAFVAANDRSIIWMILKVFMLACVVVVTELVVIVLFLGLILPIVIKCEEWWTKKQKDEQQSISP